MNTPQPHALSILFATPGRIESLREVLARLAASKASEPYEVVVIDNACEPPPRVPSLRT